MVELLELGYQTTFSGILSGLKIYRNEAPNQRKPVIYPPSVVIVGQGQKHGYHGRQCYRYHPGQLLVITAPLPVECQVQQASKEAPYLALAVPLIDQVLAELLNDLGGSNAPWEPQSSIAVFSASSQVEEAARRLLRTALNPEDTRALGTAALRELYYRLLNGPEKDQILSLFSRQGKGIDNVLNWLHDHLTESLRVEEVARRANMSVPTFHRAFKARTGMSPLQYVKTARLHKAFSHIHYDGMRVNEAALLVGYASATQFSREFKRLYGYPPTKLSLRARLTPPTSGQATKS